MRVGVLGLNHKLADLKLREKVAKACNRLFGVGNLSIEGHHTVLLSTCNRTEIYFSSDNLADTHTHILSRLRNYIDESEDHFDQKLYSYFGQDCFSHLARVTSGLDSAILGETEIQGQVKTAYEKSTEIAQLSSDIHFMFQKSLKIGKQVRYNLSLGRGVPNLENALLNIGKELFPQTNDASVLFVGASDINRKILCFLKNKNIHDITICNRTYKKAALFGESYAVRTLEWENLSSWHQFDWIIFGTKAPDYLIRKNEIPQDHFSTKLVVDLCVPRNVDPLIGSNPNVTLLNIDQINSSLSMRKKQINHHLSKAEDLIVQASQRQVNIFATKTKQRRCYLAETA